MGMGMIMSIIMGLVMTTMIGSTIGPSVVEQMKIKKVENRAISNQIAIKDAIVRYISLTGEYPKNLEDLKSQGILKDYHEDNLFSGGYSFLINEEKGTLTIYTQFNDDIAGNYFKNSFKTSNKPICVELVGEACKDNLYETFYLLPNYKEKVVDNFLKNNYSFEKIGDKEDKDGNKVVFNTGDKDYVITNLNEEQTIGEIIEYVKDSKGDWIENIVRKNVIIKKDDDEFKITFDENKIYCNGVEQDTINFALNNKGLREIVYVAPNLFNNNDDERYIKSKFAHAKQKSNYRIFEVRSLEKIAFNNMCTSNLTNFDKFFSKNTWGVRSDIVYYPAEFSEIELQSLGSIPFMLNFDYQGKTNQVELDLDFNSDMFRDVIKDGLERIIEDTLKLNPKSGICSIDDIDCFNHRKTYIQENLNDVYLTLDTFMIEMQLDYDIDRFIMDKNIRIVIDGYEEDFMHLYYMGEITNLNISYADKNNIMDFISNKENDILNIFKTKAQGLNNFHDIIDYSTTEDYSRWDLSNIK